MILQIYITIAAIAAFIICLGHVKGILSIQIVGYAFLFILGLFLAGIPFVGETGIQYSTGTTITQNGTTYTSATDYASYSNLTIGFFLSITSFFMIMMVIFDPKVKLI